MNTSTEHTPITELRYCRDSRLWLGWWLGGLAWMIHLLVSFSVVDWYCHNDVAFSAGQVILGLHVITLVCMAVALISFAVSRRTLALLCSEKQVRGRRLFLARGGWLVSVFFIVAIAMQGWANFIMDPCL